MDVNEKNMDPQIYDILTILGIIIAIGGIAYSSVHKTRRFANNRMIITGIGVVMSFTGYYGGILFYI